MRLPTAAPPAATAMELYRSLAFPPLLYLAQMRKWSRSLRESSCWRPGCWARCSTFLATFDEVIGMLRRAHSEVTTLAELARDEWWPSCWGHPAHCGPLAGCAGGSLRRPLRRCRYPSGIRVCFRLAPPSGHDGRNSRSRLATGPRGASRRAAHGSTSWGVVRPRSGAQGFWCGAGRARDAAAPFVAGSNTYFDRRHRGSMCLVLRVRAFLFLRCAGGLVSALCLPRRGPLRRAMPMGPISAQRHARRAK